MDLAENRFGKTWKHFLDHRNTHRQGVLTVNERRREKRIKTNAEVRSL